MPLAAIIRTLASWKNIGPSSSTLVQHLSHALRQVRQAPSFNVCKA